jgi:hypothetical protein
MPGNKHVIGGNNDDPKPSSQNQNTHRPVSPDGEDPVIHRNIDGDAYCIACPANEEDYNPDIDYVDIRYDDPRKLCKACNLKFHNYVVPENYRPSAPLIQNGGKKKEKGKKKSRVRITLKKKHRNIKKSRKSRKRIRIKKKKTKSYYKKKLN